MTVTPLFESPGLKKKTYTVGNVTFRMVELPGEVGFWMGNEDKVTNVPSDARPRHQKNISAFALAEFPVTQALWEAVVARAQVQGFLEEQELPLTPATFPGKNRPVESVDWHQARKFCEALSCLTLNTPDFFRLPSESEWEYAARGMTGRKYSGGNYLPEQGWYRDNNGEETMPVGLLGPNKYGLYDLSGNVSEWCEDDWHSNYKNHPRDGRAWIGPPDKRAYHRVRRGGSFDLAPDISQCTYRYWSRPDVRSSDIGFRLAAPVEE